MFHVIGNTPSDHVKAIQRLVVDLTSFQPQQYRMSAQLS
jgi:hypothetical protein